MVAYRYPIGTMKMLCVSWFIVARDIMGWVEGMQKDETEGKRALYRGRTGYGLSCLTTCLTQ